MVLQWRRNNRQCELAAFREEQDMILLDGLFYWCASVAPVGHQFIDAARVHHRAGDYVRTDFLPLLENGDGEIFIEIPELVGGRQASRPATDDNDVDFQTIAFGHI